MNLIKMERIVCPGKHNHVYTPHLSQRTVHTVTSGGAQCWHSHSALCHYCILVIGHVVVGHVQAGLCLLELLATSPW